MYLLHLAAQGRALRAGLPREEALAELHKITGSAGVFGHPEIGLVARDAHGALEAGDPGAPEAVMGLVRLIEAKAP